LLTLAVYMLLVATHLGEFWPFSIFPMFSQAGNPWTRALVRRVPNEQPDKQLWNAVTLDQLPGKPLRLAAEGVNQNDVSNFVSKTPMWDEQRLRGLRKLLETSRGDETLLVYRVRGRLDQDTVKTTAEPLILFTGDTTFISPPMNISRFPNP
jgi:hypothetical protein